MIIVHIVKPTADWVPDFVSSSTGNMVDSLQIKNSNCSFNKVVYQNNKPLLKGRSLATAI